eukprot:16443078-Heterocapsa_arctica.AAC.1
MPIKPRMLRHRFTQLPSQRERLQRSAGPDFALSQELAFNRAPASDTGEPQEGPFLTSRAVGMYLAKCIHISLGAIIYYYYY